VSLLDKKVMAIKRWRYAVYLFDSKGRRVFTDYFKSGDFDEMLKFARQHACVEKRVRKPVLGLVVERKVVASREWEAE